jgi:hypothetical protein
VFAPVAEVEGDVGADEAEEVADADVVGAMPVSPCRDERDPGECLVVADVVELGEVAEEAGSEVVPVPVPLYKGEPGTGSTGNRFPTGSGNQNQKRLGRIPCLAAALAVTLGVTQPTSCC